MRSGMQSGVKKVSFEFELEDSSVSHCQIEENHKNTNLIRSYLFPQFYHSSHLCLLSFLL